MALKHLHNESPSISISDAGRRETRFYTTTDLNDIPGRGQFASLVDSDFTSGYRIQDVDYVSIGNDQDGNTLYRVTIVAFPTHLSNPPDSEREIVPAQDWDQWNNWFETSLGTATVVKDVDTADVREITYPFVSCTWHIVQRYLFRDRRRVVGWILSRLGLVNSAAGDPFSDTSAKEWRLIAAPMRQYAAGKFEVEYSYQWSGRDYAGAFQTWDDRMELEFPGWDPIKKKHKSDVEPTIPSGVIRPPRSTTT